MKNRAGNGLWLVAFGICVASAVFGQPTVNFGITDVGPTGNNLAGVYTDPYQGCVGCTSTSNLGNPVQIFCDDFTDEVTPPEFWTAFATGLTSFTGSSTVDTVYYVGPTTYPDLPVSVGGFNPLGAYSQTTDYIASAILASESITTGNASPAARMAQNQLSFALWGIFDPGLLVNTVSASVYGTMDSTDLQFAQLDLENALVAASQYTSGTDFIQKTGINATVYSECVGCTVDQMGTAGSVRTTSGRRQEFLTVSMPEPSFVSLLVTDFAGMALVWLIFRRRAGGKATH